MKIQKNIAFEHQTQSILHGAGARANDPLYQRHHRCGDRRRLHRCTRQAAVGNLHGKCHKLEVIGATRLLGPAFYTAPAPSLKAAEAVTYCLGDAGARPVGILRPPLYQAGGLMAFKSFLRLRFNHALSLCQAVNYFKLLFLAANLYVYGRTQVPIW